MDRRPPGLGPESEELPEPRSVASPKARDLTEAELDRILPPIDENDPEWQAYVRRAVRESLDDPRPDLTAEEVRASLRAHHEERLRRGS